MKAYNKKIYINVKWRIDVFVVYFSIESIKKRENIHTMGIKCALIFHLHFQASPGVLK